MLQSAHVDAVVPVCVGDKAPVQGVLADTTPVALIFSADRCRLLVSKRPAAVEAIGIPSIRTQGGLSAPE
jgi:hypothetical protein